MSSASVSAPAAGAESRGVLRLRAAVGAAALAAGLVALAFATLPRDHAIVAAVVSAVLVVLSAIDLEQRIIPNKIVLPAAALVLVLQIGLFPGQVLEWLLGAVIAAVVFMAPQLFGRSWMGMGDVKLALLLGAALGWGVIGATLLAFVCVFPVSLFLLVRKGLAARSTMIPFGPFLSLGAVLTLFGPHLLGLTAS